VPEGAAVLAALARRALGLVVGPRAAQVRLARMGEPEAHALLGQRRATGVRPGDAFAGRDLVRAGPRLLGPQARGVGPRGRFALADPRLALTPGEFIGHVRDDGSMRRELQALFAPRAPGSAGT
jgi:hypothetical protein